MKRILHLLALYPFLLFAGEHNVPLGTQSNQFIYTVKNSRTTPLQNIEVVIESAPEWMQFEQPCVFLETIPARSREEVTFQFSISEGEADQTGDVLIAVREMGCQCAVTRQTISFQTELDLDDSALLEPYPNPANPSATIPFALKEDTQIKMTVYNILGQHVQTLLDEKRTAGRWSVFWDGRDENGRLVSSGVYLIQLQARINGRERNWNKKLLLAK